MKTLVLLVSLMMAGSAFAKSFNNVAWSELEPSGKYDLDRSDKIVFQNGSVHMFSMDVICQDGTFFYGGEVTKKVCTAFDSEGKCAKSTTKTIDLVQPMISERQRCAKVPTNNTSMCKVFETVVFKQSANRSINILDASVNTEKLSALNVLGQKAYTIPACGEGPTVPAN